MCLEYYPECGDGGDGCCERRARGGTRVSEFVDACCPVCAKAEFVAEHFFDKALDELNRLYSLIDNRTENR